MRPTSRRSALGLALGTGLAAALAAPRIGRAQAPLRLTVIHTNDFHSRHEPINRFSASCTTADRDQGRCFGGAARAAAAIERARRAAEAEGRVVVLLDAGDQFMGSLFYTHYRGDAEREVMNAIGYDAMTVGNHEFDNGPANFARFVESVRHPIVSANLDLTEEPALAGRIPGHVLINRGGLRIGVVGATTEETPSISSPGKVRFTPAAAALARAAAAARAEGAQAVIALTHVGWEIDKALAASVPGLDLVVGGHSHTLLSNSAQGAAGAYPTPIQGQGGRIVPVVQAGAYSRYLGRIDLDLDVSGRVSQASGDATELLLGAPEDPAVAALVARLGGPLEETRSRIIGQARGEIDQRACRAGECAMGNLVADAMLEAGRASGAEIALQNGGGLRAGFGSGPISFGDVLTVLPFSNTLATLKLRGSDLAAALEHGVSAAEEGSGRFPQVAGIRFAWVRSNPAGSRVTGIEVRGQGGAWSPLDPGRLYHVVTNNFLRNGGDGYVMLRDRALDAYDSGPNMEDVVEPFIAARSPIAPTLDGRIVTN